MSEQIKTGIFLIEGEEAEVVYSDYVMRPLIDPEIEVYIETINGKPHKACSLNELRDAAIQVDIHERKLKVYESEFLAESRGDEIYRGN